MAKQNPKLGIIGAGMMGSHMGEVLRRPYDASFYDIVPETARSAAERVGCGFYEDAAKLVHDSDLVILAVPTSEVDKEIRRLAKYAKPGSCFSDVTSKKAMPMKAMDESLPAGVDYFGMHPNYRATVSPYGQTIVVCPGRPQDGCKHQSEVERAFERKGGMIVRLSPEEADLYSDVNQTGLHDVLLAYVGVVGQLVKDGMLKMGDLRRTQTPMSKRVLELVGRMLGGKPHVYSGIQAYSERSVEMLERLIGALDHHKRLLESGKEQFQKGFEEYFLGLREAVGEDFVTSASAGVDKEHETPGGMQLFYSTHYGDRPDEVEKFLKGLKAAGFKPYVEDVHTCSVDAGRLGKIEQQYALARSRFYRVKGRKGGATAFYCRNRSIEPGKGIRFSPSLILNPDELARLEGEPLLAAVRKAIANADEKDANYSRVQLRGRYDDPVLRLFDAVWERKDVRALGPWIAV